MAGIQTRYRRKFVLIEVTTVLTNKQVKDHFSMGRQDLRYTIPGLKYESVFVNDATVPRPVKPNPRRSII